MTISIDLDKASEKIQHAFMIKSWRQSDWREHTEAWQRFYVTEPVNVILSGGRLEATSETRNEARLPTIPVLLV